MLINALLIITNILLFTGIGLLILHLLSLTTAAPYLPFTAFWVGWAVVIGFLQIQHFFLPIDELTLTIVAIFSLVGWVIFLRRADLKSVISARYLVFAVLTLLPLLMLANHVIFSEPSFDHSQYHLQTVKWFNLFPIVRGLGNLQHRLAFNSSSLLYASLINVGPLNGYAIYFASTSIIFVLVVRLMWALAAWIRDEKKGDKINLFYALMLPVTLWQASNLPLTGYSADLINFAIQVTLAGEFLQLVDRLADKEFFRKQALLIVMLISVGITVKLSFLVFGAALLIWLLAFWLNAKHHHANGQKNMPMIWGVVLSAWVIPWLARNVLMSGYLLYPSVVIFLPVQWKMPGFLANDISSVIAMWARTYSGTITDSADLAWLYTWILRFVYEPRQALINSGILLTGITGFFIATRKKIKIAPGLFILMGVSVLSIIFWFFSAPTYRFSGATIWIFYVAVILAAFQVICDHWGLKAGSLFSILIIVFLFYSLRTNFSHNISPARLLMPINEHSIAEQKQPLSKMEQKTTNSGLVVYIPQADNSEACWDAPLPCTTRNDYLQRLQLIVPQQLGSGFFLADE